MTVFRRGWNDTNVSNPQQRQMKGSWNRRSGKRQNIDHAAELFNSFLMPHPEPLLFIDDEQAEILECHILLKNSVGSDDDIDLTGFEIIYNFPLDPRRSEPTQTCNGNRIILKSIRKGPEMLFRKHCCGNQQGCLLSIINGHKWCTQCHFCFAVAHIPAYEPIHRGRRFHVAEHIIYGFDLIFGFFIGKCRLKIVKIAVRFS